MMRTHLSAAEALMRETARAVDGLLAVFGKVDRDTWARQRGAVMVLVSQAKVIATEVALEICMDIFRVCGARASLADEDMDRFLRDARTLTLHDPVDYKAKLVGEWLLQDKLPTPGFFS